MKQLKLLLFIRKKLYPLLLMLLFSAAVKAQVKPADQYSFGQKSVTVQSIVNTLKTKYGYKVSFDADVNMSSLVSLPEETLKFEKLTQVLQQAGIGIKNINGNLVIKKLNLITVSGTIVSAEDKLPLAGVSVSDNNKKLLTFTNNNGGFTVSIADGS